jgi:hypothetical protein
LGSRLASLPSFGCPIVDFRRCGRQGRTLSLLATAADRAPGYSGGFVTDLFPHGTVHQAGEDLQSALESNPAVRALWEKLTPLGRNEFICWVEDARQPATRRRRIDRTCEELLEGKKRPCCWAGCIHRTDKPPGRWQQAVLIDGKARR